MIETKDLGKVYRLGFWRTRVEALKRVDLAVREGDLFGFIGPNGAGKSTTIKILFGLLRRSRGEAWLMGKDPADPSSRKGVGYCPEQPYFYDYLTGHELLNFYGGLLGLSGAALRARVEEVAALVGARPDWLRRKLRTYSKGMQQRVGLAQALLGRPKLLILDEPMSGLDPMGRRDVRNLLQRLHAEGTTIFYSSHVLGDVEAICTRVAMVVRGEVRRQGTVEEVLGGEAETYQVSLAGDRAPPLGLARALAPGKFECRTPEEKRALLQWACAQGVDVRGVEARRPTLEDALAEEVARA